MNLIVSGIFLLTFIWLCISWYLNYLDNKSQIACIREEKLSSSSIKDIYEELDKLIDIEIAFSVELPFEGRDVKRITDFEGTLSDITTNVINSLDEDTFFTRAKYAGLSEHGIYEYVTRSSVLALMAFMAKTNTGITPKETEEE